MRGPVARKTAMLSPVPRRSTTPARLALGLSMLGAACDPAPASEPVDRTLQLMVDASTVEPRLPELGVLSVEVYGLRQTTSLCTLARRCLYPFDLGDPRSGAELQAALRQVQPLVEVDAADAHQVAVVGRPSGLCDERGPFGRNVPLARRIRADVRAAGHTTPVVAAGGICEFAQAEAILGAFGPVMVVHTGPGLAGIAWWWEEPDPSA